MFGSQYYIQEPVQTGFRAAPGQMSWFAVQTRHRHEKRVAQVLQEREIPVFLPLTRVISQWSDRRRMVELPLFSNYVFVRTAPAIEARVPVLQLPGVLGFVGNRGIGTSIADEQIDAIRTILEQEIPFAHYPFLQIGQRVRIRGGSLDGVKGILLAKNGDQSLIVSVDILQKSLSIRVTGYNVEPL